MEPGSEPGSETGAEHGSDSQAERRWAAFRGTATSGAATRPVPHRRPARPTRTGDGARSSRPPQEALERGELPPAIAWRLGDLADRLGLTGDDRERFLEIQRRFFVESHQRRSRILGLQDRFRRALAAPDPSRETIDELIRQLGEERAGFDRDLARTVLDTRALLGPGQERQYLEFLARLGPRPGGPGGPGGEGQPGPPPGPGRSAAPGRAIRYAA